MPERRELAPAMVVFATVALFLTWLIGNRLVLVNDEGIYLDGAVRLLQGSRLYRDFFALTGPGTFWNLALLFRFFGVSLAAARVLVIADLALIAACMYWLIAKFRSRQLAFWVCGCYVALLAADTSSLVVNHRWDSTACSLVAVACFVHGMRCGRLWPFVAAGAMSSYAAWITPPVGLIAVVLLAWIFFDKRLTQIAAFSAGLGAVSVMVVAELMWSGSLPAFVTALFWTASQYSGANHFSYGAIIGGYGQLFSDARGLDWLIRLFLVFFVALPAIIPILALSLSLFRPDFRRGPGLLVALCATAAVAGCYPRMDVGHLIYAAPLWYVIAACSVTALLQMRVKMILVAACSAGAFVFGLNAVIQRTALVPMRGRVGGLAVQRDQLSLVRDLTQTVGNGDDFFAFPYLPIAYFLTGGRNPTRYSFLQPGMMSDADEQSALDALTRSPPSKVLYMDVPTSAYLRLFPSSDPARLRMRRIEIWLGRCYERSEAFSRTHAGYDLLLWRGGDRTSCPPVKGYN
jgi:hypothetical protein